MRLLKNDEKTTRFALPHHMTEEAWDSIPGDCKSPNKRVRNSETLATKKTVIGDEQILKKDHHFYCE